MNLNDLASKTAQPLLTSTLIKNQYVATPLDRSEQTTIANFLNHKTQLIDDLIAKKERLIELLQEERTAMINQAVTKGLDPNVPMKDSGIEWLGEIPEHWELRKVSRSFRIIGSGTTPKSGDESYYEGGTFPWVLTGDLNDTYLNDTSKKITQRALNDYSTLRQFPIGSVVIAMYGATIGKLAILGIQATTNQACCVINESEYFDNNFLFYWLLAKRIEIISLGYGGGQPNISQEIIRFLKVPCPPKDEQQSIINHIIDADNKIDETLVRVSKDIELLKEYKTSLINEAVTGKIDVRDYTEQK